MMVKDEKSPNYDRAAAQVHEDTPAAMVELIARQMERADDAKRRIDKEQIIVRDLKGSTVTHPAVEIEKQATKMLADLFTRFS